MPRIDPPPTALITDGLETWVPDPLLPAGRVLVPLALFHFQALGKWGRLDEEKRLSSLIARVARLPGLCLEKPHEGAHAPPSGSLWASGESDSQNGDETVKCGLRASFVGLSVNGTGAQGETWGKIGGAERERVQELGTG